MGNNSFLGAASSYFDKIMKQKFISKAEILSLKQKFKTLKEADVTTTKYNNILNRVTRISDKAIGKNNPAILQNVYADFKLLAKIGLTLLKESEQKATTGMYKVCIVLDNCLYQIGKDSVDREHAFTSLDEYPKQTIKILNDKGQNILFEDK